VDPAERLDRSVDHRGNVFLLAQVGVERYDGRPQLGGRVLLRSAEVHREHARALAHEDGGARLANAAPRARDHRRLALEQSHQLTPLRTVYTTCCKDTQGLPPDPMATRHRSYCPERSRTS